VRLRVGEAIIPLNASSRTLMTILLDFVIERLGVASEHSKGSPTVGGAVNDWPPKIKKLKGESNAHVRLQCCRRTTDVGPKI
jgi:hypothetical protein